MVPGLLGLCGPISKGEPQYCSPKPFSHRHLAFKRGPRQAKREHARLGHCWNMLDLHVYDL